MRGRLRGKGMTMPDESARKVGGKSGRPTVRFFLLLWMFLALGVELGLVFLAPVRYTGETMLERRSDATMEEGNASGRGDPFESRKLTLEHDLIGFQAVAKAAEDEGLTRGLPHGPDGRLTRDGILTRQELVNKLIKALKITWDARSEQVDLVTVSFTHNDPNLAEQLPNTLVKNYTDSINRQSADLLKDRRDFLHNQVELCAGRFDDITSKLLDFEVKHAGVMPEDPFFLHQRIEALAKDIDVAQIQSVVAREKLARLKALVQVGKGAPGALAPAVAGSPTAAADDQGVSQEPSNAASQMAVAEAEVSVTDRELSRLQAQLAECQAAMMNFGPIRQEYLQISQKQKEAEAESSRWQQQESAVQMALVAEVNKHRTHLNAVQLAQIQTIPDVFLQPGAMVGLSLCVGFVLAGMLAFLRWGLVRARWTTILCLFLLAAIIGLGGMSGVL
jgi:hypothetical protein